MNTTAATSSRKRKSQNTAMKDQISTQALIGKFNSDLRLDLCESPMPARDLARRRYTRLVNILICKFMFRFDPEKLNKIELINDVKLMFGKTVRFTEILVKEIHCNENQS